MSKLWIFGDSTSYGHGLRPGFEYYDNYESHRSIRWTEILSDYFNAECINFGRGGASNEDIRFRVTYNLHKIKSEDVVIIQTTYPTRFDVFTNDGEYKTVHLAISEFNDFKDRISDTQKKVLSKYVQNFILDNEVAYETRDNIYFESLKRELEMRGVTVILWSHDITSPGFLRLYNIPTIYDETNGLVDDLHIGWMGQTVLSNIMISEFEKGNRVINPNINYRHNPTTLRFDYPFITDGYENTFEYSGETELLQDYTTRGFHNHRTYK